MRVLSYQQFAIVQADTAEHLTERLNRKLYELRDKDPVVSFEGLIARISYHVDETIDDPVKATFESKSIKFRCKDCPHFEPLKKQDGTPDRRTTFGFCRFAPEGQTIATSTACDKLYDMIKEREVKLCLAE